MVKNTNMGEIASMFACIFVLLAVILLGYFICSDRMLLVFMLACLFLLLQEKFYKK